MTPQAPFRVWVAEIAASSLVQFGEIFGDRGDFYGAIAGISGLLYSGGDGGEDREQGASGATFWTRAVDGSICIQSFNTFWTGLFLQKGGALRVCPPLALRHRPHLPVTSAQRESQGALRRRADTYSSTIVASLGGGSLNS